MLIVRLLQALYSLLVVYFVYRCLERRARREAARCSAASWVAAFSRDAG